jgi:hypothetical protein
MTLDLDTFLVALYTIVDDLYQQSCAPFKPLTPGQEEELSDSEVLTLAICAQWYKDSETGFLEYALNHWRSFFPRLLDQSAYNRRIRNLVGALMHLLPLVAAQLGAYATAYQALDTVPVPVMRCCRGKRHRLFGDEASVGKGGSDRQWYYGCKLLLAVTQEGVITGFVLAPASTEDHWVGEAFLCWRANKWADPFTPEDLPRPYRRNGKLYVGPTGALWPRSGVGAASPVPYVADDGFFGAWWTTHWQQDYGATVFTPKIYQGDKAKVVRRQHKGWRQVVETINEHLEHVFGLNFCGARSKWGLLTRVAAKLVALNLGIWLNRLFGRPDFAFATLFSF